MQLPEWQDLKFANFECEFHLFERKLKFLEWDLKIENICVCHLYILDLVLWMIIYFIKYICNITESSVILTVVLKCNTLIHIFKTFPWDIQSNSSCNIFTSTSFLFQEKFGDDTEISLDSLEINILIHTQGSRSWRAWKCDLWSYSPDWEKCAGEFPVSKQDTGFLVKL